MFTDLKMPPPQPRLEIPDMRQTNKRLPHDTLPIH